MTNAPGTNDRCLNCHKPIEYNTFTGMGKWEPDAEGSPLVWRHQESGYAACNGFGLVYAQPGWPEVVTLCGSTKFRTEFFAEQKRLTLDDRAIVISVGTFGHLEGLDIENADGSSTELKIGLDELHKRKIDLSDRIHVINVDDYIGASTRSEIVYAQETGKTVTFMVDHTCIRTYETSQCIKCGRL